MSSTRELKPDTRIPALDGLRGVASLMVVAYHFGPHIVRDEGSAFRFLHRMPPLWFEGVDLFFVLSGFLISGILVSAKESPRYFQTFYARRAFRIFPLYYMVLIGYVLATAVLGSQTPSFGRLFENPLPVWTYTVYLQNFAMAATNSYGPIWLAGSWSLAIEEQFYFTLPGIVRYVGNRGLFCLTISGIAGAPLLRALIQKFKFVPGLSNNVLLLTHFDALAVGVLVMLLLKFRPNALTNNRRKIALCSVALFFAWTIYPYVPNPQIIRMAFINTTMNSLAFGALLLCLMIVPKSMPARFLSTSAMRALGNWAYSTYLFHPILLCIAFRIMKDRDPLLSTANDLIPSAVALLATLGLAWLSWSQFESKILKIGHRFRY